MTSVMKKISWYFFSLLNGILRKDISVVVKQDVWWSQRYKAKLKCKHRRRLAQYLPKKANIDIALTWISEALPEKSGWKISIKILTD